MGMGKLAAAEAESKVTAEALQAPAACDEHAYSPENKLPLARCLAHGTSLQSLRTSGDRQECTVAGAEELSGRLATAIMLNNAGCAIAAIVKPSARQMPKQCTIRNRACSACAR